MNRIIIIGGIVVVLIVAAVLFFSKDSPELNELPATNEFAVTNLVEDRPMYDDIVRAGLKILDIQDVYVVIKEMSPDIQRQYDWENNVEIEAFLLNGDGADYMIVIDTKVSDQMAIFVIAHELIHLKQIQDGELFIHKGEVYWRKRGLLRSYAFDIPTVNTPVDLNSMPYELRPWEREAQSKYRQLGREIRTLLTPL